MAKTIKSKFVELIACEEAIILLKESILKNFNLLADKYNLWKEDEVYSLICQIHASEDYAEVCSLGSKLNHCMEQRLGKPSLTLTSGLSAFNQIQDSLKSDLGTLNVVISAHRKVNETILNSKDSWESKQPIVERAFNQIVSAPTNKETLEKNTTIKSTGFFQLCKEAWCKFFGIKTYVGRFFRPEEKIAQQTQATAKRTPPPSPTRS